MRSKFWNLIWEHLYPSLILSVIVVGLWPKDLHREITRVRESQKPLWVDHNTCVPHGDHKENSNSSHLEHC